jgi:cytochrome oxidase Cu insertion factor (SCO1/SenC/PrrC family)
MLRIMRLAMVSRAALGVAMLACVFGDSRLAAETVAAPATTAAVQAKAKIRLVDLDGNVVDLPKVAKGRVHVTIFIRSDCPISNRMAPEVRDLCKEFQAKDVDFYLIYVDPQETDAAIREHLKDYKYPCTALRDSNHAFAEGTGATVTPEAVVFNDKWAAVYRGRINDMYEDFGKSRSVATKRDLRDAIAATLAGKAVAEPVTKAIGCYISDLK